MPPPHGTRLPLGSGGSTAEAPADTGLKRQATDQSQGTGGESRNKGNAGGMETCGMETGGMEGIKVALC